MRTAPLSRWGWIFSFRNPEIKCTELCFRDKMVAPVSGDINHPDGAICAQKPQALTRRTLAYLEAIDDVLKRERANGCEQKTVDLSNRLWQGERISHPHEDFDRSLFQRGPTRRRRWPRTSDPGDSDGRSGHWLDHAGKLLTKFK